ncbi:MAG: hypothetical protein HYY93_00860 [Planctomycetes bacterium]|nr:hypothetical protein [Planctomycetota bacterium]
MTPSRSEPGRGARIPRLFLGLCAIISTTLPASPFVRAQGAEAGGVSPDAPPIPVKVSISEGAGGVTLQVQGAYDLPDDATATVYFSNAVEFTPLRQVDVSFKGGRYALQLGPFPELCPGHYLIRVDFTPWLQSNPIQDLLRQKNQSFKAKGEEILAWRTDQDVQAAAAAYLAHVNSQIREMRSLLIELERKVPEYRDRYTRTHDAEEAQQWHLDWRNRATALHTALYEVLKKTGFGAPYRQPNEVLLWMANRLGYYGNRYAVRIVGDEQIAPEDVGKPMEDLAKVDRLPSGMIRTQFFDAYRGLRNLVAYDDPNRTEATKARPKLLASFTALVRAHETLSRKAEEPNAKPPTRSDWEGALAGYRKLCQETDTLCRDVLIFCDKQANRRGITERAGADLAATLLQLRTQIEGLQDAMGKDLLEKKDPDGLATRIEGVVVAVFRPALSESLAELRDVMQEAVGNMTTAVQKQVRNRTPYLAVLDVQMKNSLPPIRARFTNLEEMLKPLDPENRVVRHYAGQIERGKAICDQMRDMMAEVRAHVENYVESAHPSIMPLYDALGEFEKGLTPPPPPKKKEP